MKTSLKNDVVILYSNKKDHIPVVVLIPTYMNMKGGVFT